MIPKIHKKGHSFGGVANYVLHDKDKATTDDRVAWTETRNLATDDPHVAWRVMAATALDQERLKEAAGVRRAGRKSSAHVLHYTLSWHEDEAEGLTQEEMMRAVDESLAALGKEGQLASEHQAFVVCHDDEPQPHVHVIINRVHPEHGVMLSSSNDRLKLSEWAERYEKERGKVFCEQRVKNNEARRDGQYVKGEPDKPRHLYELDQKYKDHPDRDRILAEQRKKDRQLARRTREYRKRREDQWKRLRASHRKAKEAIREQTRLRMKKASKKVYDDFTPKWKKLYRNQRRELYEFAQREQHFMGRIHNAMSTVTLRSIMYGENRGAVLTQLFQALTSKGVRLGALEKVHLSATRKLQAAESKARDRAVQNERDKERKKLAHQGKRFLQDRDQLVTQHEGERSEIDKAWQQRKQDRAKAWEKEAAARSFNAATRNVDPRKGRSGGRAMDRNPDPRKRGKEGPDRGKGRNRER